MTERGRPSTFTDEAAAEICERISQGETLAQICRDAHMPAVRTVSDWAANNTTFSADFARAREDGFDAIASQALDIADDGSRDYKPSDEDGGVIVDHDHISRSKLRVDTRLKLLAKWSKRYSEKMDLTVDASVKGSVSYQANIPTRG